MNKTILTVRIFFITLCILGSCLIWYSSPDLKEYLYLCLLAGALVSTLTVLIDILIKGSSLRGLTTLAFGLAIGSLVAFLIGSSPLFDYGDPQVLFISRISLFAICTYIATVLAIRGKDDFNLLIPYIRFVPHNVDVPVIVVDTSILVDGRIVPICQSRFISAAIIIPKFIIEELHRIADSTDLQKQIKGRKGLEVLNKLKNMNYIDLRLQDVEITKTDQIDAKLIYLCQNLKAKLLTTDFNLAKLAEFQNVEWLNLNALCKALNPDVTIGQYLDVDLVKSGKEEHQGVGYLSDGSMVVVNEAAQFIGKGVTAEVISVLPSAGGKMIFARLHNSTALNVPSLAMNRSASATI